MENPIPCFQGDYLVREAGGWRCRVCETLWPQGGVVWMGDDQAPLGDADVPSLDPGPCPGQALGDDETPCVYCGAPDCARTCFQAHLGRRRDTFAAVQARAQRLYAAYVAALGPLGTASPPWHDLIDRQQYAWRCIARAGEDGREVC